MEKQPETVSTGVGVSWLCVLVLCSGLSLGYLVMGKLIDCTHTGSLCWSGMPVACDDATRYDVLMCRLNMLVWNIGGVS